MDQVDDFFGTKVPDPYRWLENSDAPDTRAWIDAENKVTFDYLSKIPERAAIQARLKEIWNYERYGTPSREGAWYIYARNSGLQPQAVIYKAKALAAEPEVAHRPQHAVEGRHGRARQHVVHRGRALHGLLGRGERFGLDRVARARRRDVARTCPTRSSGPSSAAPSWLKDGSGFYYSRYDEPKGEALQALNKNQKVFFHALGTTQDKDPLVYERPDKPDWGFGADVTEDGRFLLITQSEGTDNRNRVFVRDLKAPGSKIEPFLDDFDATYSVVGNDGDTFYVLTNKNAPRFRLVAIQLAKPAADGWKTLIPEAPGKAVLEGVTMVNDQFVTLWMTDAHHAVRLYARDGAAGAGSGDADAGQRRRPDRPPVAQGDVLLVRVVSSTRRRSTATTSRPAGARSSRSRRWRSTPRGYETVQVFYPSKDGTRIPMFLTYKKGLQKNGQNPTLLYGYGGFNIATMPAFSPGAAGWLEMGGIYAVANLRGGGEYGQEWHDAGRLQKKQNVFDDFIAAAEYLIREEYTSTPKLAIHGGSNGGLLVGACMTQRPDLFGAALPAVGVMDMLRFDKFTIGWAWRSDYGQPSANKADFDTVMKYSPLHNIKPGVKYPATMVTTADHDDRVVPAAQLQVHGDAAGGAGGPGAHPDPDRDQGRPRGGQADGQGHRRTRRHVRVPAEGTRHDAASHVQEVGKCGG